MIAAYRDRSSRTALTRYVVAATLVRGADGGAAVGLVLLAVSAQGYGPGGTKVAGLLAAALTAPHVLGPWLARGLERKRDGRVLLAGAFVVYGVALGASALALGRGPVIVVAGAVAVAGARGPPFPRGGGGPPPRRG